MLPWFKIKQCLSVTVVGCACLGLILGLYYSAWSSVTHKQPIISPAQQFQLNLTVLATNDLHSNFDGLGLQSYPEYKSGHYARLSKVLNDIRGERKDSLVVTVDAGDWYSGSLFDNLASSKKSASIPQLEFFDYCKYDAVILGNHEFDMGEDALYIMLEKARVLDLNINILGSNMVIKDKPVFPDSRSEPAHRESSMFDMFRTDDDGGEESSVRIKPYVTRGVEGAKVCILGYTGPDAALASSAGRSDIQYIGYTEDGGPDYNALERLARQQVKMVKHVEQCEMVIALLHGGLKDAEDLNLANVQGVDLVIAGHTHERYLLETNSNSFISQCGSMGEFLTALNIGMDDQRKLHIVKNVKYGRLTEIESPQCVRINSDVGMDAVFDQRITGWIAEINEIFEMEYSSIVFKGDLSDMKWDEGRTNPLPEHAYIVSSLLLSEAALYAEEAGETRLQEPFGWFWTEDFIRMEKFTAPDPSNVTLTYSDAYNMVYITARRPLSVFYIHKSAVQVILCGVEVVQTFLSGLIRLTIGGMTYEKNSYGIPFYNRFGEFKSAAGVPYKDWPDYIKIVTNSFAAPFLWKVESMSKGIITENLAKDSKGGDISLEQSLLVDGPTEFDLFLRILRRRSLAIPS